MTAVGTAAAGRKSDSGTASRVSLSPAHIKQTYAEFAVKDASHEEFLQLRENRNLPRQMGTLLQLLTVHDHPLTIEADTFTSW